MGRGALGNPPPVRARAVRTLLVHFRGREVGLDFPPPVHSGQGGSTDRGKSTPGAAARLQLRLMRMGRSPGFARAPEAPGAVFRNFQDDMGLADCPDKCIFRTFRPGMRGYEATPTPILPQVRFPSRSIGLPVNELGKIARGSGPPYPLYIYRHFILFLCLRYVNIF